MPKSKQFGLYHWPSCDHLFALTLAQTGAADGVIKSIIQDSWTPALPRRAWRHASGVCLRLLSL